jgi:hypothetical protein
VSACAGAYLLVQVALPLLILRRPGHPSRDFSWDMFSHYLSCTRLDARARVHGGPLRGVRLDADFGSWSQLSRVLADGRLEAYAQHLCRTLRSELAAPVELYFIAECRQDRRGPAKSVVDPERDYCRAQ